MTYSPTFLPHFTPYITPCFDARGAPRFCTLFSLSLIPCFFLSFYIPLSFCPFRVVFRAKKLIAKMKDINGAHRSVADAEEENGENLGFETPTSGIATPQPDLHDKRLPGIATSFGQVGTASLKRHVSASSLSGAFEPLSIADANPASHAGRAPDPEDCGPGAASPPADSSLRNCERQGSRPTELPQGTVEPLPLPTPPTSGRSSSSRPDGDKAKELGGSKASAFPARSFLVRHTAPDVGLPASTFPVSNAAPLTSVVTASAVAPSYSTRPDPLTMPDQNPIPPNTTSSFDHLHTTTSPTTLQSITPIAPPTPSHSRASSALSNLKGFFSLDSVKILTKAFKSGPSTPTRTLSTAQPAPPAQAERNGLVSGDISRSQTPKPSSGSTTPAAKGKLTIKITEARGIKKSRDPYVVAVFQRNELISGGPRPEEEDDETPPVPSFSGGLGGVAIQRQGSDSGRPMAIPMRSRQSSSTSVTEHNTLRNRTGRKSFSSPKWDAEAVL